MENHDNILLERVRICHGIAPRGEDPERVRAHAHRPLHLTLPYDYLGAGGHWEAYAVELETSIDGGEVRRFEHHDHDHQGRHPTRMGHIHIAHPPLPPGEHDLEYTVRVRHVHGPRGEPDADRTEDVVHEGVIHLNAVGD